MEARAGLVTAAVRAGALGTSDGDGDDGDGDEGADTAGFAAGGSTGRGMGTGTVSLDVILPAASGGPAGEVAFSKPASWGGIGRTGGGEAAGSGVEDGAGVVADAAAGGA